MSPRAAWRLERLGFGPVYDYVAGKVDWMAAGRRTVRADTTERRAIKALDDAPPTCAPETPLGNLPQGRSVTVVNADGVVLGRVPANRPDEPERLAEDVMQPGSTTVRAHEPLDPLPTDGRTRRGRGAGDHPRGPPPRSRPRKEMTINHKLGIEHRCTDGTTLLTAGLDEHAERLGARAFAALWRGTSPLPRDLDARLDPDVPFDVFRQLAAVGRVELDDAGRVVGAHGIHGVRDAARHRGQGR